MEEATTRHFFNHGATHKETAALKREKRDCHWCQLRSLPTAAEYPVSVVNEVDDATISPDFRFLKESVLGRGVRPAEDSFRTGCECEDDEECQYDGCMCLQDEDDSDAEPEDEDGRRKLYRYHMHGAKAGLLRRKFFTSKAPIYECHERCRCSQSCPNRVVERGRKVPLQIFRTEHTGWGVRALADIKAGQFVDKYVGEIITPEEAQRRRDASGMAQRKDVYLFALDKFTEPDSADDRLRGPPLEIDGEFMSGPTRFINHSCDPNLRIFARVGDHADKHLHDIAMFAIKDITRGDELNFDYVSGMTNEEDDWKDESKQDSMTKCLCGSENCRGFLW